jgi:hypothetical protein
MKWGTDQWGEGENHSFDMPSVSTTIFTDLSPHIIDLFPVEPEISVSFGQVVELQQSQRESLEDGSTKYLYSLPGGVTNDENAYTPTYTNQTTQTTSWTTAVGSPTTWT